MKKGKLIAILGCLLLLSGCTVEYNLTIDKDNMTENIKGIYANTKENQQLINTKKKSSQSAYYDMDLEKTNYYTITTGEDKKNNLLDIRYQYVYDSDNLQKSNALNYCVYKKTVIKTDKHIIINTDGKINCMYKDVEKVIDKLVINIKTDLKVVEQNADKHKGNTYTWIVTDDNFSNKPIHIKISLEKEKNIFEKMNATQIFIIVCCAILFIICIALFFKKKIARNNSI